MYCKKCNLHVVNITMTYMSETEQYEIQIITGGFFFSSITCSTFDIVSMTNRNERVVVHVLTLLSRAYLGSESIHEWKLAAGKCYERETIVTSRIVFVLKSYKPWSWTSGSTCL